jgi:hypothetical protein
MKWFFSYVVYFLFSTGVLLWSYLKMPGFTAYFAEDGYIESFSAGLLLASFLTVLFAFRRQLLNKGFGIKVSVAFISMLAFLEEISYGKRIFHFASLSIHPNFQKVNQAQDFYDFIFFWMEKKLMIHPETAAYGLLCFSALLLIGVLLFFRKKMTGEAFLIKDSPFFLFTAFVVLVGFAKTFDLDFLDSQTHRHIPALEEIFELNAAAALLFCSLNLCAIKRQDAPADSQPPG